MIHFRTVGVAYSLPYVYNHTHTAIAIFGHVARLPSNIPACHSMLRQVELLVGRPQTLHGSVHQVDHVPNGPTNSAAITTMFPLRLCGGKLLVTVTRERCYGPSRLPVNDDDDIVHGFCSRVSQSTFQRAARSVQPFHACNQQTVTLV